MSAVAVGTVPTRLDLDPDLTIVVAAERRLQLLAALNAAEALDLGLGAITELDTAGLQLLFMTKREAALLGKPLRLLDHSDTVLDVLAIAHLTPDLEAADASPAARDAALEPAG